jgi:hypothetical protein
MRMNLSTLEDTRRTFSRVIRRYNSGKLTAEEAKTFAYLFSQLLAYWRTENELRLEARLDELEADLNQRRAG